MNRWFAPTLGLINFGMLPVVAVCAALGRPELCFGCCAAQGLCLIGLKYREAFH